MTYKEWTHVLKIFDIGDNIILSYIKKNQGEKKLKCGIARLMSAGISVFLYEGFPLTIFLSYQRVRYIERV